MIALGDETIEKPKRRERRRVDLSARYFRQQLIPALIAMALVLAALGAGIGVGLALAFWTFEQLAGLLP